MDRATQDFALRKEDRDYQLYTPGRRCREQGCITLLCIYNPGPECYVHAPKLPWVTGGAGTLVHARA